MKQHSDKQKAKGRHLARNMAMVLSVIMICIFACLIGAVILMSGSALRTSIGNEFTIMAKGTGVQVENILASAENSAGVVVDYLTENTSSAAESAPSDQSFTSAIYGTALSENSYEAEKYMIQTLRQSVKNNRDIVGMGVLFEPYAFDPDAQEYAFYLSKETADEAVKPYLPYREYSANEYYTVPSETLETHLTAPYEDAGYTMVTYCHPILVNGRFIGIVTADINIGDFSRTVFDIDGYSSRATAIINENGKLIYSSEGMDLTGADITEIIDDPKSLKGIQTGMSGDQPFRVNVTRITGKKETCFYSPIISEHAKWWSVTALERTDIDRSVTRIIKVLILIAAVSLAVTLLLVTLIIRKMLRPIDSVVEAAKKIASGNLDIQLEVQTEDEIGTLTDAFNRTIQTLNSMISDEDYLLTQIADGNFDVHTNCEDAYKGDFAPLLRAMRKICFDLSDTLGRINQSADMLAANSEQVAYGSQALSQGTGEQAASMEELTAAIEAIEVKIRETAQNAWDAQNESEQTGSAITACNAQMQELMAAMNEINQKSSQIDNIIKTIEDIAFQTNILALNASVEAARAGDAGRGFAVVANEVRGLASRSSDASKDTAALIRDSISAVKKGAELANRTAVSLLEVVDKARTVTNAVVNISAAANEQATSITQITQSIEQISGVVQTNSATAEESAAASEELAGLAQILKSLVGKFKLRDSQDQS